MLRALHTNSRRTGRSTYIAYSCRLSELKVASPTRSIEHTTQASASVETTRFIRSKNQKRSHDFRSNTYEHRTVLDAQRQVLACPQRPCIPHLRKTRLYTVFDRVPFTEHIFASWHGVSTTTESPLLRSAYSRAVRRSRPARSATFRLSLSLSSCPPPCCATLHASAFDAPGLSMGSPLRCCALTPLALPQSACVLLRARQASRAT